MTVNKSTGAAFDKSTSWMPIKVDKAEGNVRRLQTRIVKAAQEKRWGKVKALQRLLTCSISGKSLAVKRVTDNRGSKTPGVDGEIWQTASDKAEAIEKLQKRGYNPLPLRRIKIPKANGKMRPLGIPTMHDRAMQALHLQGLDPVAEVFSDHGSYGFRKERSVADAIEHCFSTLARKISPQFILEADIKACFDRIDHAWLIKNVLMDKSILTKWLKAGFMEQGSLFPTDAGTPQGGICSPTLANIALNGLEELLRKHFPRRAKERWKVSFVRYADDFIVTSSTKECLEEKVKPLIEEFLKLRGLEFSQEKTLITHINEGFDFLGHNIRKYGEGKLLITPAKKNVKNFLQKIRKVIKESGYLSAAELIRKLNPIIRGWANFFRSVVSKETFASVDREIFLALWKWMKRKHPNKSSRWIKDRYFSDKNKMWQFCEEENTERGKRMYRLYHASDTEIIRHLQIRRAANPYDPEWDVYFENRHKAGGKMKENKQPRKNVATASRQTAKA